VRVYRTRNSVEGLHDAVALQRAAHRDCPGRAGNRRFQLLSALHAHTKAPYKNDLHRITRRVLSKEGA
jgi:hypothetical protein